MSFVIWVKCPFTGLIRCICAALSTLKHLTAQRFPSWLNCPSTPAPRGSCCGKAAVVRACSRAERLGENILRSPRRERRSTSHIISPKETLGSAASLCFPSRSPKAFFVGGMPSGASISPSSHGGRAKAGPRQQTKECLHEFGTTDLLSVKESRKRTPGLTLTAVLFPSLPVGPV